MGLLRNDLNCDFVASGSIAAFTNGCEAPSKESDEDDYFPMTDSMR